MMDYGQNLCAVLGGKSVASIAGIVGGMRLPLFSENRDKFSEQLR